jgi:hypothetical protein
VRAFVAGFAVFVARPASPDANRFREASGARRMRAMKTTTYVTLAMMICWLAFAQAGAIDRVGFPADYTHALRQMGDPTFNERSGISTVYANELAASAPGFSQARYPNGSVIVMEFAEALRDGEGELLRDARGVPLKGRIAHLDVMRRGAGFGEAYGENRAGEWEFASYSPDGSTLQSPDKTAHCAGCHRNAGADKDFVFRTRPWTPAE